MSFWSCLSIVWLLLNLLLAIPPLRTLYRHIKQKSLVSVTLVDLIYQDIVIGIYLIGCVYSVAIVHCIVELENGQVVGYNFAAVYSGLFDFIVLSFSVSLILSGGLRLLSMMYKSEVTGLQLLGPDSEAITKARIISTVPSAIFECVLNFYLDTHPGLFNLLHEVETSPLLHGVKADYFKGVSIVMLGVASVVNLAAKIYSLCSARKLNQIHPTVFTVEGGAVATYESGHTDDFSLPLGPVVAIPLMVVAAILSSYAERKWRLLIFCPLQPTIMSILLPLYVISGNEKMKKDFMDGWINLKMDLLEIFLACFKAKSSSVAPALRSVNHS